MGGKVEGSENLLRDVLGECLIRRDFVQQELLKRALEMGFETAEVYVSGMETMELSLFEGEISAYENNQKKGLSFRGIYEGYMGYAYTEEFGENAIEFLIEQAKENALLLKKDDGEEIYAGAESYPTISTPYNTKIEVSEALSYLKEMEEIALHTIPTVTALNYCIIATLKKFVQIQNTKGLDISYEKESATAYVGAIAKADEEIQTAIKFYKSHDWSGFDGKKLASETAKKADRQLKSQKVASGVYDVLLTGEAMAMLLGAFSPIFYAENVQKGLSLMEGNVGKKVASECVVLRDNPLLDGGYASVPFDSEGVASFDKVVIENGVLKTLLYNLETAKKDGVSSTGNGFKGDFRSAVKTSTTNFYIEAGNKSQEELEKEIEAGLLITKFSGLHAGINTISGEFSLLTQGFLIESGVVSHGVEQIILAGNIYDVLKQVKEVGNEIYYSMNGTGSPCVWVSNLSVAGA